METESLLDTPEELYAAPIFKVKIGKADLANCLSHMQNVVERKTSVPILSHIKIEAEDDCLILTATDMELAVVERIEAEVTVKSSMTVPAHKFYDIIKKLPSDREIELTIVQDSASQLLIRSGQANFNLATLPVKEFPQLDKKQSIVEFKLPAVTLNTLIDKTKVAISTDETRYYLNGVFFELVQKDSSSFLRAVATDCHRLAMYDIEAPAELDTMPNIIIPKKAIHELSKILVSLDSDIEIGIANNKITFSAQNVTIMSKLIDGQYPNYNDAIPKNNSKVITADAAELASAVDRVSTITTENFKSVKLAAEDNILEITAMGEQNGYGAEKLVVNFTDEKLEIGFNYRYLLDILSVVEGSKVELILMDGFSPAILRDTQDDGALFVLMPMRY